MTITAPAEGYRAAILAEVPRVLGLMDREPLSPTRGCCDRMGEYNGYGSDGPTTFTCPRSCACHD